MIDYVKVRIIIKNYQVMNDIVVKPEEVMIGDYFTIIESRPCDMAVTGKIEGIYKTASDVYVVHYSSSYYDENGVEHIATDVCTLDRLRPIELTPDFLIYNGWKQYKDQDLYVRQKYWLSVEFFEGHPKILRNLVNCDYIHQLQHVLNITGADVTLK